MGLLHRGERGTMTPAERHGRAEPARAKVKATRSRDQQENRKWHPFR